MLEQMKAVALVTDELESGRPLNNIQSETYLDLALKNWLLMPSWSPETKPLLAHLAGELQRNHRDPWLSDFMKAPMSARGNTLLMRAIQENYAGEAQKALVDAGLAEKAFSRGGNVPGVLRSEFERVYSLGRQSRVPECLREERAIAPALFRKKYQWLQVQWLIEDSICEGLSGHFDAAMRLSDRAQQRVALSAYPSLALRVTALRASAHNLEGRFFAGWSTDEQGLDAFWHSYYSAERGFQFYSDLELSAERNGQWHLASKLQEEVIAMLSETKRRDFQAVAHFHLGLTEQMNGEIPKAQEEYSRSDAIFAVLPGNAAKFYHADAQIGLVELDLQRGQLDAARALLTEIGPDIAGAHSFVVSLRHERAWAHLQQLRQDPRAEATHLRRAVTVGNLGFSSLNSDRDRWQWDHEVGEMYRRLIQLETMQAHDPRKALIDWEIYRRRQGTSGGLPSNEAIADATAEKLLTSRSLRMGDAVLLTLASFSDRTVIWTLTTGGVREFQIPIPRLVLEKQVNEFRALCADKSSAIEKVNRQSSRLYQLLLAPLEEFIQNKTLIYVAPDGPLAQIPWSALTTRSGDYFGERHLIVQTPGFFSWGVRRLTRPPIHRVLIAYPGAVTLGSEHYDPLPGAEREDDYLQQLYPDAPYLKGTSVTAERLLQELPTASLFQFAGHARTREYGGELLIQGKGGGDVLSASSLSKLHLARTALVVLSACSTAAAQGEAVRDPNGLVRAFLRAGVHQVLASEWDVDSTTTSEMMVQFYRTFHEESDAPASLRSAQVRMMASGRQHPYYWGSFQLFGDFN